MHTIMENKQGYVYILTNDSFREDWVKIGKSSRPVDVRSKELDNTAVPLPFDIYATLRTVKYDAVEKQLHRTLDLLTNTRIRKKREFFNVKPEQALQCFQILAATIDDAVIEIYDKEGKVVDTIVYGEQTSRDTAVAESKPLFFAGSDKRYCRGTGFYDESRKEFTLLAGSILACEVVSSLPNAEKRIEFISQKCTTCKEGYKLKEDITFTTPSKASDYVLGRPSNGWTEWKNKEGKTLDEVYRQS